MLTGNFNRGMHSEENRNTCLDNRSSGGNNSKIGSGRRAKFNYVDAFAKSILFYEANWCGPDAGTTG